MYRPPQRRNRLTNKQENTGENRSVLPCVFLFLQRLVDLEEPLLKLVFAFVKLGGTDVVRGGRAEHFFLDRDKLGFDLGTFLLQSLDLRLALACESDQRQ